MDSHKHEATMRSKGWVVDKEHPFNLEEENHDVAIYEGLLQRLDDLIASGQGDSNEADGVRDQMDDPWRRLTGDELSAIYQREARRIRNVTF